MWLFMIEALKTIAALVVVAFLLVAYLLLSGCASVEGAGFTNNGQPSRPACVERDGRGHERWRTC